GFGDGRDLIGKAAGAAHQSDDSSALASFRGMGLPFRERAPWPPLLTSPSSPLSASMKRLPMGRPGALSPSALRPAGFSAANATTGWTPHYSTPPQFGGAE